MNANGGDALFVLIFMLIGLAAAILWIWALIDALRVSDDSLYRTGTKVVWILVIVLTGVIGAIIYLAIGRPSGSPARGSTSGVPPPPPPR